jgi:hypothetical protein
VQVGASHLGGNCSGFDIDIRVLKGNMHAGVRTGTKPQSKEGDDHEELKGGDCGGDGGGVVTKRKRQEKNKKKKQKTPDIQRSIWENFR